MPYKPHDIEEQYTVITGFKGMNQDLFWPLANGNNGELFESNNVVIKDGTIWPMEGGATWGPTVAGGTQTCYGVWNFNRQDAGGVITRQIIAVFDDTVYELTSGPAAWTSRGTLTSGSRYCTAAQAGNRLFISNGECDPVVWDGSTLQDVNVDAPNITSALEANPGGQLINGDYKFRVTLYSSTTGDESIVSNQALETVTLGASSIVNLTVANMTFPARFDRFKVYRTTEGGETELYDSTYSTGVTSGGGPWVIPAGQVTDENLGDEAPFDNDPMPNFQILWFWDGRLFGCYDPDNPTQLGWSKVGGDGPEPTAWPQIDNRLDLDKNDGHPLTGMRDLGGRLFVFKDNAVYLISPISGVGYGQKRLPTPTGLQCHWLLIEADNALWGVGRDSFWRFDGGAFNVVSRGRHNNYWQYYNEITMEQPAFAAHFKRNNANAYVVAMPDSIVTVASGYVDLNSGSLTFTTDRMEKALWELEEDDGSGNPLILRDGGANGTLVELFKEQTYTYMGAYGNQKITTQAIDPAPQILNKQFLRLDLLLIRPIPAAMDTTIRCEIYYDDPVLGASADFSHVFPAFDRTNPFAANTKVLSTGLDGVHARNMKVMLQNDGDSAGVYDGGFFLVGIGILWKPADLQVAL